MIYVDGPIGDPKAFVEADASLRARLADPNLAHHLVISGTDLDVLVSAWPLSRKAAYPTEQKRTPESLIFGSLYERIEHVVDSPIDDNVHKITAYPSPVAVNGLLEELGLKPGEDVPLFAHTRFTQTPGVPFSGHFQKGEYPQAGGEFASISKSRFRSEPNPILYFNHDRQSGHAIGAMVSPARFVQRSKDFLGRSNVQRRMHMPHVRKHYVKVFDRVTFDMGCRAENSLWPDIENGRTEPIKDDSEKPLDKRHYLAYWLRGADIDSGTTWGEAKSETDALIFERLLAMKPHLDRLKAAHAASHAAADNSNVA